MTLMSPGVRKLALVAHVSSSVGWFGAVVAFVALAVAGLGSQDPDVVRGAYLMMELTGSFVLVPLSLASLATGLVQSLGTRWGLVRHYWILAKLLINVVASAGLVTYTQTLADLADLAVESTSPGSAGALLASPTAVVHSGAALVLLVLATILSVYKPAGMTPYGHRKHREQRTLAQPHERDAVSTGSTADMLTTLADLKGRGLITDAEFADQKAKILS